MSSPDRVRVGVIGVGQIGKHHLDNYKKIPNAEVVAIADVNQAEAERVGSLYGIPNVYTDFRQLLASRRYPGRGCLRAQQLSHADQRGGHGGGQERLLRKADGGRLRRRAQDVEHGAGYGPQVRHPVHHDVSQRNQGRQVPDRRGPPGPHLPRRARMATAAAAGPMWTATAARPLCRSSTRPAARSTTWASITSPPCSI